MMVEDYAIVLDYLPSGRTPGIRSEPLAQVLGTEHFTLLEIVPKEGASIKMGDRIYIGKEERKEVDHIKRRILYKGLTNNSVAEADTAIEKLVKDNEVRFVKFFNEAGPITIRRHQLELLPGLGKKHMLNILDEREKKPFESFKDIEQRVKLMPDPAKTIVKRILEELGGEEDKHYLFARAPVQPQQDSYGRPYSDYGRPRQDFGRPRFERR